MANLSVEDYLFKLQKTTILEPMSERKFTTFINCADKDNTRVGRTGFNTFSVQFAHWDLDTVNNWNKLNARKLVIYHPEDPVMQHENLSNVARRFMDRVINLKDEGSHMPSD